MLNWKTSVAGLIAALSPWLKSILPVELHAIVDAVQSLALAALGYFSADALRK